MQLHIIQYDLTHHSGIHTMCSVKQSMFSDLSNLPPYKQIKNYSKSKKIFGIFYDISMTVYKMIAAKVIHHTI